MHWDGPEVSEMSHVLEVHTAVGTCKAVATLPCIALV